MTPNQAGRCLIFFLAPFMFAHSIFAAPSRVGTYDQLLKAIRETTAASQQRIEAAVEQEKVREAWEIGKLIDEHILQHKERAGYGEYVIKKLADDLEISRTELYYMVEFARAYPIVRPAGQLSWSHYQALLRINDPETRRALAEKAEKENWSKRDLQREIASLCRPGVGPSPARLEASLGETGTYRVIGPEPGSRETTTFLDLGFSTYFRPEKPLRFEPEDIVTLDKGKLVKTGDQSAAALFTYAARVKEVIDGDTVSAFVELGFGITTLQTLRLRALDAREIESAEGREAKAFLEKHFAKTRNEILIKTSKSDKYDRYLADIWAGEVYVNQALIDEGLAVIVNE